MSSFYPLVSVLIPSYNHDSYIEQAIRSVWSQSYSNIELVVVDDCSTDSSIKILKKLHKEKGFLLHQNKSNLGSSKTLNLAANLSNGKYLALFSSDDIMPENSIEDRVSFMQKNKFDLVFGKVEWLDRSKNMLCSRLFRNLLVKKNITCIEDLFFINYIAGQSVMLTREAFLNVGGYSSKEYIDDLYLWLRLLNNKYNFGYLPKTLAYYRDTPGSMSKDSERMKSSFISIINYASSSSDRVISREIIDLAIEIYNSHYDRKRLKFRKIFRQFMLMKDIKVFLALFFLNYRL